MPESSDGVNDAGQNGAAAAGAAGAEQHQHDAHDQQRGDLDRRAPVLHVGAAARAADVDGGDDREQQRRR